MAGRSLENPVATLRRKDRAIAIRTIALGLAIVLAVSGCAATRQDARPAPPPSTEVAEADGSSMLEIATAALMVAAVATGIALGARGGALTVPPVQLDTLTTPEPDAAAGVTVGGCVGAACGS